MTQEREATRAHTEATLDPRRPLPAGSAALGTGRFGAVYEIGRQLLEQTDPGTVLQTIHDAIVAHLKPDRACLLTLAGKGFRARLAHNLPADRPPDEWPLSWSVIRHVVESGLAVLASDIRQDAQFAEAESIQRFRIRSILCVPLGSPARGVLYLDNRSARPFAPADLEFLTAVALYASLVLERTEELARAGDRLDALQTELLRHEIVGAAPALLKAYDAVRRFARSGARVLLRGETGTGKELFARAYAAHTPRPNGSYVPVTIPALAPTLVESELFGHVKGAFTEAARDKKGRLEIADGGVLFLDEVGDIDPAVQTKLLRFLDSGELFRVGDTAARQVDALVVSATNRPLERDVEQGRFRADLLARLGHMVTIPPLRERGEDVPRLVDHFLARYGRGTPAKTFSAEAMDVLRRHHWPFNVRELQQVVERAVCLVDGSVVRVEDLPDYLQAGAGSAAPNAESGPPGPLRKAIEELERRHILRALEHTKGNKRRAMELLQLSPETFYRRLEDFGLHKKSE
ncbi:MAG TPA: sigma-54-dependent Fis family transcriptional regulator [Vicinamibacteria bacterium]|nr:sigma-54-dependent Fis family transcriptional regulator [Vicinamibacteria bacterium]